jgi:hypothetical protein
MLVLDVGSVARSLDDDMRMLESSLAVTKQLPLELKLYASDSLSCQAVGLFTLGWKFLMTPFLSVEC